MNNLEEQNLGRAKMGEDQKGNKVQWETQHWPPQMHQPLSQESPFARRIDSLPSQPGCIIAPDPNSEIPDIDTPQWADANEKIEGIETRQTWGHDPTNPPYYTTLSPEPVDVIEQWGLGWHLGSALGYIARAGKKPGIPVEQDIQKAIWFLSRYLKTILNGEKHGQRD